VGAVGARVARQFHSVPDIDDLVLVDPDEQRARGVARSLGGVARSCTPDEGMVEGAGVVVVAADGGHRRWAERALEAGAHVVSTADSTDEVRGLLDLDAEARERGRHIVVGAGFSPGLTCVLARHGAADVDAVDEIHVAKVGTAGPACARQHHDALGDPALDWRDGAWLRRRGGSGRELCWFPDPVGGVDCYRAALPDALLLVSAFPGVARVTARVGANRRDRLTSRLPMLRPPHPEGKVGAVRVEVRGRRGQARDVRVLGAMDLPAVAAGAVAAVATGFAVQGRLARAGAAGLAELAEPVPFLQELARRGVRAAAFEGSAAATRG
jgi:hypothetical protein